MASTATSHDTLSAGLADEDMLARDLPDLDLWHPWGLPVERGIELSSVQVYRLVAQTPERLNLKTLAALCDIFSCTPSDLIEPVIEETGERKLAQAKGGGKAKAIRPTRARVTSR